MKRYLKPFYLQLCTLLIFIFFLGVTNVITLQGFSLKQSSKNWKQHNIYIFCLRSTRYIKNPQIPQGNYSVRRAERNSKHNVCQNESSLVFARVKQGVLKEDSLLCFISSPDKNNEGDLLHTYGIIKNWSGWYLRIYNPFTSAKGFARRESMQQSQCCNLIL